MISEILSIGKFLDLDLIFPKTEEREAVLAIFWVLPRFPGMTSLASNVKKIVDCSGMESAELA